GHLALLQRAGSGASHPTATDDEHWRIRDVVDAEEFIVPDDLLVGPGKEENGIGVDTGLGSRHLKDAAFPDAKNADAGMLSQFAFGEGLSHERCAGGG